MTQNRRDGILEYLASTRYVRRLNVRKDLAEFTKSTIEWMLSTASAESLSRIDFVLLNSIQADCEILVSKAKSTIVADLSVFEFIMEINARCKSAEPEEGRPYWEATALGHASLCAEQHLPAMFLCQLAPSSSERGGNVFVVNGQFYRRIQNPDIVSPIARSLSCAYAYSGIPNARAKQLECN